MTSAPLLLIALGVITASLAGYFFNHRTLGTEGILEIGRFAEVFLIFFLVRFFQSRDAGFYKKAALAQLSTLVYLVPLFLPSARFVIGMYRFNFLENWASNADYYLIASLTLIWMLILQKPKLQKAHVLLYAAAVGLSSIFLWAQTRAAWLGFCLSFALLVFFWANFNFRKIAVAAFAVVIAFALGFLLLRPQTQELVMAKIFPAAGAPKFLESDPEALAGRPVSGLLSDPYRLELWKIYWEKIRKSPLGFGANYEPVDLGRGPQGPHNTALEFLVLAGPLGLFGFAWLAVLAFKNAFMKIQNAAFQDRLWPAYLFASLAGLLLASLFDNMAVFRLMWLILGMAVFA